MQELVKPNRAPDIVVETDLDDMRVMYLWSHNMPNHFLYRCGNGNWEGDRISELLVNGDEVSYRHHTDVNWADWWGDDEEDDAEVVKLIIKKVNEFVSTLDKVLLGE